MPRGPSEAIVTKFLRDALAVDAVGPGGHRCPLGEESAPRLESNID
jgi:hypothetical protein